MTKVKNYLLNYDNMHIIQDTDMFNFSLDSVLLPNFVTINKKTQKILDIGSGNAPIPLILSTLTDAQIMAVEIQKDVYELGKESIKINKLENRIDFINADINELYKEIDTETFDVITCNPPYFKVNESSNLNDSEYKTIARHEIKLDLEKLFKIAKKLLKNKGNIAIVHRPERLSDIVSEMKKNNIEPKRIQFVYPSINSEANILLIEGTKNGNPGVKILPPLISHKQNGEYTEQVKQFFEKR
ncbi:MAG: tRNA1(Val) (adenine(37)-N6)-methyltransferase [Bacilli bacterium]|nr:tRNA1(Val) (adenine(37)-N6)-methyltransferase [Bacilli bacterium]